MSIALYSINKIQGYNYYPEKNLVFACRLLYNRQLKQEYSCCSKNISCSIAVFYSFIHIFYFILLKKKKEMKKSTFSQYCNLIWGFHKL